ncbi:Putative ABC transport system permease protein [Actinacidiphila bryophytorum]|uniref:ABC transport system permease protein n=2 Tax=Actinacidiphila bryophytorum TaxID=1436133 RepID=A0A9W4H6I1_9ACTN|nr:Putative ABC transport system permease protein [Actinacidiphila bryophytorum]
MLRWLRPGSAVRDPGVRREAWAEAPLLACLTLVVALLALVTAAGPPLLDRWAADALRSRLAVAQQNDAEIRHTLTMKGNEALSAGDPSGSTLAHDLRGTGEELLTAAEPPLKAMLVHGSTRVEVPQLAAVTAAGPLQLGLLYADDAPPGSAYTQGSMPGPATATSPIPVGFSIAARDVLHLRVGQRFHLWPDVGGNDTDAVVTGFFAPPTGAAARLWHEEALLARPIRTEGRWRAQAVVDAASIDALLQGSRGQDPRVTVQWRDSIRMTPGQATRMATPAGLRTLRDEADSFASAVADVYCPAAEDYMATPCSVGFFATTPLTTDDDVPDMLVAFARARDQARTLESFALAGLIAVGLATVVVTARLAVHRRAAAQALQRARGASATDLALVRLLQTAPAALLGAVLGTGAAVLFAPAGGTGHGSLLPALVVAAVAWLTLPLLTLAAARDRSGSESRPAAVRRLAVEGMVLLLAVAGVLMVRAHGAGAGGQDVRLAVVPALLGAAAVVLLVRLYPLPLRLVSRAARGRRGTVPLIAFSRAAREAPGHALALLVLVMTLSTAVFGGLVSRTVADGSATAAVWSSGADAVVIGAGRDGTVDKALATVQGVRKATVVRSLVNELTSTTDGARYTTARVAGLDAGVLAAQAPDSAAARALTAAGLAGRPEPAPVDGHYVLPALASADFAGGTIGDTYSTVLRRRTVSIRVVGRLPDAARRDPALGPLLSIDQRDAGRGEGGDSRTAVAAGSPLLLVDAAELRMLGPDEYDNAAVLLYGPHLDGDVLRTEGARIAGPSGQVRIKADELSLAAHDGLLRGVRRTYAAATALAVLFALMALLLELLLSARDRGRTASRLRTLGLPTRSIAALDVLELTPMTLAAAAGGVALGLLLPSVLGPALTLREFTGGPAAPALHTDYALTAGLGVGLVALVTAAVAAETWAGRRRGLGTVLRLGDSV